MNRRSFLAAAAAGVASVRRSDAASPPNIVLILADDLGYGDVGSYGSNIPTPNLNKFAKEGTRLRNFYAPSPVCTPARAGILTGRYAQRMGLGDVLMPDSPNGMPSGEATIPQLLRGAGYKSSCIGKWHLGAKADMLPTSRGFDEFYGIPYSHDLSPLPVYRNAAVAEADTQLDTLTARFTGEAVAFIKRNKSNPFFLYLAHVAPHIPLIAGRAFRGMSQMGNYGDVVMELDWSVGQVMKALTDNGLDSNTLVIFTSDNGPWYEGTAGRLRGRKGETWDGGMRVPFLARWPGQIKAGQVVAGTATGLDLLPTCVRLSGAAPPTKKLDGVDIWPLLTGEKDTVARDPFFFFDGPNLQAVRIDNFKLHVARCNAFPWVEQPVEGRMNLPLFKPELYNLDQDATESMNIAAERPHLVAKLQDAIAAALPTFPQEIQDAWQYTTRQKVIETPTGALPRMAPPPRPADPAVANELKRRTLFFLFFALACNLAAGATAPPSDVDAWVARAMREFDVPGVGVAIIKDGQTVLQRGYGVRKLGDSASVDEHTLFGIASNSKAFTATALAILVDEGKIAWDDPVQKHLPSFAMYDPYVSREMTVRDLLCHRAGLGLGAGDLLFWPDTDVTREQVVAATRFIRPASSFRSKYAYNNLAFVVAGEVIHAVTGKRWDDFIRERIFAPLGMGESQITTLGFRSGDNVAAPHSRGWRLEGKLTPIPPTKDDTWAAAAGVKSNLADLTKWVAAHLAQGKVGGKQLWSEKAEYEMWSPQTILNIPQGGAEALRPLRPNFSAYGLGFQLRDYKGRKIVSHGGALTGMLTTIYMVPQENLGIIVLTNQEESGLMSSVVWHIIDHYLDQPANDWIAAYKSSRADSLRRANEAEKKREAARAKDSKPSLPLSGYAGTWADAWYGNASLTTEGSRLVLKMSRTPAMVGDLEHWQYNTFKAVFRDKTIPDAFVTFRIDAQGKPDEMRMEAVSSLADFSFDYQDLLFRPQPPPTASR